MERSLLSFVDSYQDMNQQEVTRGEMELSYEQLRALLKYFGLDDQADLVILRDQGKKAE